MRAVTVLLALTCVVAAGHPTPPQPIASGPKFRGLVVKIARSRTEADRDLNELAKEAAARVGSVYYVVVHKCSRVQQFDRGCERDQEVEVVVREAAREQCEARTEQLAPSPEDHSQHLAERAVIHVLD